MLVAALLGMLALGLALLALTFQSWGLGGISLLLAIGAPGFYRLFADPRSIVLDSDGFYPGPLRWPLTWERMESAHAPIKPMRTAPWTIERAPKGWSGQSATLAIVVPNTSAPWTGVYPTAVTRELFDAIEQLLRAPETCERVSAI